MKKLLVILTVICTSFTAYSQNVRQDAQGNYIAATATGDSTSAKPTGKTYTDTKGIVYPVYVSKKGKLFVIRVSKTGIRYNYYLNPIKN
jgi:hypothetical protein